MTQGPFLWLSPWAPAAGFREVPRGGMCLSVFVFVTREDRLLAGTYANDPHWETLTGLDEQRRIEHGAGWTVPASHLRFGEDPRAAARRIMTEVLRLPDVPLSEPVVEVDAYGSPRRPDAPPHFDVWFFVDAALPADAAVDRPPWFRDLAFVAPSEPGTAFARGHDDVVARWRARAAAGSPSTPRATWKTP